MYTYTYVNVYICIDYYSAMKMNNILPFVATWMDFKGVIIDEVHLTEEDRYHVLALMHVF